MRQSISETQMDFFQTREKYRRREMRFSLTLLFRVTLIALVAWFGWLWGTAEQKRLQADYNLAIFESDREIQNLSRLVEKLETELTEANAQIAAGKLTDETSGKVTKLVKAQIANGTKIEQIYAALQSLGVPTNCRLMHDAPIAVATALYGGEESRLSLFDGALRLSVEGAVNENGNKTNPWFDANQPIKVRQSYLGGQRISEERLPFSLIVPAQDWMMSLEFRKSDLSGYVNLRVKNCVIG